MTIENENVTGVDPNSVPKQTLASGDQIPVIGLGTFGSDCFSAAEIAKAVEGAAAIGYRHFDCASVYGNEASIGKSLKTVMESGIRRDELWITSKVWNDMHGEVAKSCEQSLKDLQLDYLDLFLIHWPFPNFHAPGCDVNARNENAQPYTHETYMKTWRQMEALHEKGWVKNIGTSNMTQPKMALLLRDANIKPVCNEMELHPHFQQQELFQYLTDHQVQPIGFCPIGSPARPERDKTPEDTVDIEDPVIIKIAERLNIHPATVCIKWAIQRGQVPIPFSIQENHYFSNLQSAVSDPISEEEMKDLFLG